MIDIYWPAITFANIINALIIGFMILRSVLWS